MDFSIRAEQKEIMDQEDVGLSELRTTFKDINRANKLLGGHRSTHKAISSLIRNYGGESIRILDVGCGDGATLRYLTDYFRRNRITASLYGLDINKNAIQLATKESEDYPEIKYIQGNILSLEEDLPDCDIVISILTLHHFSNTEIPAFLNKCKQLAKKALVINDLHRNRLAYYLFKIFSAIFIRSSIAKKDGLVSIRNGFRREELQELSGAHNDWDQKIIWRWAFRYVWVMERNRLKDQ